MSTPSELLNESLDEPTSVAAAWHDRPNAEGWWMRDRGDTNALDRRWFEIQMGSESGNPPLLPMFWSADLGDLVYLGAFARPLDRWFGPVQIPEEQMTDPKLQIVRDWLGEDNPYDNVHVLLTRLSAAASQPADVVERVAKTMVEDNMRRTVPTAQTVAWERLDRVSQEVWRNLARAALSALPSQPAPGRDDAERFVEFVRKELRDPSSGLTRCQTIAKELDRLDAGRKGKL